MLGNVCPKLQVGAPATVALVSVIVCPLATVRPALAVRRPLHVLDTAVTAPPMAILNLVAVPS